MRPGGNQETTGAPATLDDIRIEWGTAYEVVCFQGLYCARRKSPSGGLTGRLLSGETPGELLSELRDDWGEEP